MNTYISDNDKRYNVIKPINGITIKMIDCVYNFTYYTHSSNTHNILFYKYITAQLCFPVNSYIYVRTISEQFG